ncbi:hypothetical protein ACWN8V_07530 [Vagococcus elongatus]|uniref:Uncharacterized protein n=1 Tax=Vagococcus elongatus TaxID=180344 RepID=A0A430AU54_9ENTE|nr:hypothetical protein [Vagococcus elongatus]RSU11587.1 hypothetical protein CBF29_07875 [Vagococcus elongatus]
MNEKNIQKIIDDIQEVYFMAQKTFNSAFSADALLKTATAVVLEDRKNKELQAIVSSKEQSITVCIDGKAIAAEVNHLIDKASRRNQRLQGSR